MFVPGGTGAHSASMTTGLPFSTAYVTNSKTRHRYSRAAVLRDLSMIEPLGQGAVAFEQIRLRARGLHCVLSGQGSAGLRLRGTTAADHVPRDTLSVDNRSSSR